MVCFGRHWLEAVEESEVRKRKDKEQRNQHTRVPCVIGRWMS